MPPMTLQQIPVVFKQALALQTEGDLADAESTYQSILGIKDDIPEVHFQLGQIEMSRNDLGKAAEHFKAAIQIKPSEAVLWKSILGPLRKLRDPRLAQALEPFLASSRLPPPLKAQVEQALIQAKQTSKAAATVIALRVCGQLNEGVKAGLKLLKTHPKDYILCIELALLQTQTKATTDALRTFKKAIKLRPDAPFPRMQAAIMLQRLGEFDKASDILRAVIARHPNLGEPYWLLIVGTKLQADDPLIAKMQSARTKARDPVSQMFLGYALGKAMQDTAQHSDVFEHLNTANSVGRKMFPYDVATRQQEVAGLKSSFRSSKFMTSGKSASDIAPIFVTGMPRSGTTLVEQIIASHRTVTAGGETGFPLSDVYNQIWDGRHFKPYGDVTPEQKAEIAQSYRDNMRKTVQFGRCVTDKSIQSHLIIGPLLNCMPDAKVVVVHRDPRDVALSCYKNYFAEGTHRYTNDLEDLARYIQTFQDSVRFWREMLPQDAFYEITYEDLIADPEGQSKQLIAACGLDWDDNCLNFHQNTGAVSTLSVAQVRKPIYASSARAWEKYESELQPLIKILEAGNGII